MLSKAVQEAINEQIKYEFESAYVYLSMSAYCEGKNLRGFAHWLRQQSQEELTHAMRLFDYLVDRGSRAMLQSLEQPPSEFKSPLDLFEQALAHEQKVTGLIHRLYELAVKENDYATQVELQWFITEQVEEEKKTTEVLEQLKLIGNDGAALFMLDRELASRNSPG